MSIKSFLNQLEKFKYNCAIFRMTDEFLLMMPNLKVLDLCCEKCNKYCTQFSKITDASIGQLINLSELSFSNCPKISDESIGKLVNLSKLDCSNCRQISDVSIANLVNLTELDCSNCPEITDLSINLLVNLQKLKCDNCELPNYKDIRKIFIDDLMEIVLLYVGDCKIINAVYVYYPNLLKKKKLLKNTDCTSFICRIHNKKPKELLQEYVNNRMEYVDNIVGELENGEKIKIGESEYMLINGELITSGNNVVSLGIIFESECEYKCVCDCQNGEPWEERQDPLSEGDFFIEENNVKDIIMVLLYSIFEVYYIKYVIDILPRINNKNTNLKYMIYLQQYAKIYFELYTDYRESNFITSADEETLHITACNFANYDGCDRDCYYCVTCTIKLSKQIDAKHQNVPKNIIDCSDNKMINIYFEDSKNESIKYQVNKFLLSKHLLEKNIRIFINYDAKFKEIISYIINYLYTGNINLQIKDFQIIENLENITKILKMSNLHNVLYNMIQINNFEKLKPSLVIDDPDLCLYKFKTHKTVRHDRVVIDELENEKTNKLCAILDKNKLFSKKFKESNNVDGSKIW